MSSDDLTRKMETLVLPPSIVQVLNHYTYEDLCSLDEQDSDIEEEEVMLQFSVITASSVETSQK